MTVKTPFKKEGSGIFGIVSRPYVPVSFWLKELNVWTEIMMIVDSGADYTLLPKFYAEKLGVNLRLDTSKFSTAGVGGSADVHILKKRQTVRLFDWKRKIPLGFLDDNDIPPLLGRQGFMDTFSVCFRRQFTEIGIVS
jgi:predicted aspartyl protease